MYKTSKRFLTILKGQKMIEKVVTLELFLVIYVCPMFDFKLREYGVIVKSFSKPAENTQTY